MRFNLLPRALAFEISQIVAACGRQDVNYDSPDVHDQLNAIKPRCGWFGVEGAWLHYVNGRVRNDYKPVFHSRTGVSLWLLREDANKGRKNSWLLHDDVMKTIAEYDLRHYDDWDEDDIMVFILRHA